MRAAFINTGLRQGVIAGRRRGTAAHKEAVEQLEQNAESMEQTTEKAIENFEKAVSVRLEAEQYMVKHEADCRLRFVG